MSDTLSLICLCILFGSGGAVIGYQVAKSAYEFDREFLTGQRDKMWMRRIIREKNPEDAADWWKRAE